MSSKSGKTVKSLNYKHGITVRHGKGGRIQTTVVGLDSLNTWTRATSRTIKGQRVGPGVTVRTDHVQTVRFEGDVTVVGRSTTV